MLYVLCQLVSGKIKPDIKKIWMVFAFLGIIVPIVYYIDVRYDVNFMFVRRPSPGSPLSWLADITGEKGYLTGYAVLVLGVIIIMNIIFNFLNKHKMIIK